jgi:hypothetical protein
MIVSIPTTEFDITPSPTVPPSPATNPLSSSPSHAELPISSPTRRSRHAHKMSRHHHHARAIKKSVLTDANYFLKVAPHDELTTNESSSSSSSYYQNRAIVTEMMPSFQEMFSSITTNNNNYVTHHDIEILFERLKLTEGNVTVLLNSIGVKEEHEHGGIQFEQFCQMMAKVSTRTPRK